jgi:mannosyltransferase PIG-V
MTDVLDAPPASGSDAPPLGARPEARAATPAGPATWRNSPLWRPAAYYVASRAVILVAAAVAALFNRQIRIASTLGSVWDGHWYLWIAQHGYPHRLVQEGDGNRWAFFPAFPALVRAVASVTHLRPADAAIATAFVLGLTATLAMWLALREVVGTSLADRATLLFVFCPTAYVLSLGYTEGLFLTAAALSLFALSRRWWVTAGLCACVAGLTRNTGIAVIAAVVVTGAIAAWRGRAIRPLAGAALAPLGLVGFMAYGWAMVGTPVAFLNAERFWQGQHFVCIWLLDRLGREPELLPQSGAGIRNAIPLSWWIYTGGALLIAYSAYFTDSIPRYAMVAFPLFAAFAWKLSARITGVVAALMACMQVTLFIVVLTTAVHPSAVPLVP